MFGSEQLFLDKVTLLVEFKGLEETYVIRFGRQPPGVNSCSGSNR